MNDARSCGLASTLWSEEDYKPSEMTRPYIYHIEIADR